MFYAFLGGGGGGEAVIFRVVHTLISEKNFFPKKKNFQKAKNEKFQISCII